MNNRHVPAVVVGIVALVILAYSPSLKNQFVNWDDDAHLLANPFVHPVNVRDIFTTTVNGIYIPLTSLSLRKDVLYAFFYILALLCYLRHLRRLEQGTAHRGGWGFCLTLIFGFLSVLAKPMALSLPFVFYIQKMFFPDYFVPIYHLPAPVALTNPGYLFPVFIFVILLGSLWSFRRNRLFIFANLFYILSIFFLLRLDHNADINVVGDRFMYLPMLGWCLFLGDFAVKLWTRYRSLAIARSALLFAGIAVLSFLFCAPGRAHLLEGERPLQA